MHHVIVMLHCFLTITQRCKKYESYSFYWSSSCTLYYGCMMQLSDNYTVAVVSLSFLLGWNISNFVVWLFLKCVREVDICYFSMLCYAHPSPHLPSTVNCSDIFINRRKQNSIRNDLYFCLRVFPFSLGISVKTWSLQLDSTWGRSPKETSPSRYF